MSDKAEKKPADKAPAAEKGHDGAGGEGKSKGGGLLSKLPVLLGGAMVIEAVVLFAGFKFLGGAPKSASAVEVPSAKEGGGEGKDGKEGKEGAAGGEKPKAGEVELALIDFRAPNKQSGRTFLYDVTIVVSTKAEKADKLKELISSRDGLIKDRVRTIIGEMDPEKLGGGSEPGLETLRRQVKFQLDKILDEGLVDEVLVPRCIPFRTDY